MRSFIAILLLLFTAPACAQADGPYVLRNSAGGLEAWSVDGQGKRAQPIAVGATFTVPAVASAPAFTVTLRAPAPVAADVVEPRAQAALFVVADTHGEYELLVAMLRKHGVVDDRLRWSFGRGHLVVLGDVFDRGPNHTEILWLLYQLEADARSAGGGAHLVLGNHETMVMRGDLRYLNPKYARSAEALGVSSYAGLFGATSVLGQWLRSRPAVLKVGDVLCLHAGISRALLDTRMSLADINAGVRAALGGTVSETSSLLLGPGGPLWYRGYFPEQRDFPTATMEDVDRSLAWFSVRRILVGHTIVPEIASLYGGKVIAVQVYPKREDTGQVHFESLLIRRGALLRASLSGVAPLAGVITPPSPAAR